MTVTSGDVLVETFPSIAPLAYRPIFSQEPSGVQHRTLRIAVGRTTEAYQYAKLGFRRLRQAYDVTSQRCNCPPYLSLSQRARCRQQIAASVKEQYASFGRWLAPHQLPIVYNDVYNVSFMGIENLHVFDSKKFRKVVASLERDRLLKHNQVGTAMAWQSNHIRTGPDAVVFLRHKSSCVPNGCLACMQGNLCLSLCNSRSVCAIPQTW